ncbi:MAG TPA: glycosyltransferase family 2 protein [Thermoanaerobaculia bacterium]|nr:glycosyltransferase family 2 protein [Thermoanaerobaculia bacterium]
MSAPRVAAIVLSYEGRQLTLAALPSLLGQNYPACDVLVVDNGSTDGTAEAITAAFPAVTTLRTEVNLGPSGGATLGMRWAMARGYDYLLILNNDIEVAPDMVAELVKVAESDPSIGIVGPKCYYFGERDKLWSVGGWMGFREAVTKDRARSERDRGQWDRDEEVDFINGCAMLVRREVVAAIGYWDPLYELCFEDADFCWRALERGYRCYFAHRAKLWHKVSVTTGGYKPGKNFHSARSTAIFIRRYARPWQKALAVAIILLAMPLAFGRELTRGNQRAVTAKLRGYRAGFSVELPKPPRYDEE